MLQKSLTKLTQQQQNLDYELKEKVNLADMKAYVLRSHFDTVILALGQNIDKKCDSKGFQDVANTVQVRIIFYS